MKPVRKAGVLVAPAFLAGSVVLTVSRLLGSDSQVWALASAFVPWAVAGYTVAGLLILLLMSGASASVRRLLGVGLAVALVGVGLHVAWLSPSYAGAAPGGQPDLTVLSLNLRLGRADPDSVAALLREERPGVVVFNEITPEALTAIEDTGVIGPGSPLVHRGGRPLPLGSGTVVVSRWPLARQTALPIAAGTFQMRVTGPRPFWLTAVHAAQPLGRVEQWRADHRELLAAQRRLRGPRMMVGDFNATLDHATLRRLLDTGLEDAAREANSGVQPTWPAPGSAGPSRVLPFALITIDHVLVSEHFASVSTSAHTVSGTDHRGLVARLRVRGPDSPATRTPS